MDCLFAKCASILTIWSFLIFSPDLKSCGAPGIPTITDCVMAELEKLGPKYRMALKCVTPPAFTHPRGSSPHTLCRSSKKLTSITGTWPQDRTRSSV